MSWLLWASIARGYDLSQPLRDTLSGRITRRGLFAIGHHYHPQRVSGGLAAQRENKSGVTDTAQDGWRQASGTMSNDAAQAAFF